MRARSNRAGASDRTTHHPRVAQQRRAPLLQRGGWGFESLAADLPLIAQPGRGAGSRARKLEVRILLRGLTPLKLSSAERPPCKRTGVGSIPTWGSDRGGTHGSPRVPPSGATAVKFQPLVAQRAEAPGSDPGGSWFESTRGDQQRAQLRSMRRRSIGRTPGCYPVHAGSTPAVAASHTRPLGAPGRRSRPPPRAPAAPRRRPSGLCYSAIPSGTRGERHARGVRGCKRSSVV